MKINTILLAMIVLAIISCGGNNSTAPEFLPYYNNVPGTLTIGGNQLAISAYLWRDFMPVVGPDEERPLYSSVNIRDINGNVISDLISVDSLWVISYSEIWGDTIESQRYSESVDTLYLYNANGPTWDTGIYVDVVIRLNYMDTDYYLMARNQCINRTE